MSVPVTATVAALCAVVLIGFAIPVVALRARHTLPWGTEGRPDLHRAVRAHANFAEYAPVFLIVLGALELSGTPASWLTGLAGVFLGARIPYAAYFYVRQALWLRIVAFWGTMLPLLAGAALLLLS